MDRRCRSHGHTREGYNDLLASRQHLATIIEEQAAQADEWWDSEEVLRGLRTQLLRRNLLGDVKWKSLYILPPQSVALAFYADL